MTEKNEGNSGNIPVLRIQGKTLPETWEKSVLAVWEHGVEVKTEYDKTGEPPSKDCTMVMEVQEPFTEPRIHLAFPGGIEDLEKYRQEVVMGAHDHWIMPEDGKWTYTYHARMFNYKVVNDLSSSKIESPYPPVDQIDYMVEKLSKQYYSRRAQAVIWMPTADPSTDDCPCLQRVWCRILENEENILFLNMNTHWRSRDAYKAAFMNIYAFTELQREIANKIGEKLGKEVQVGRYVDITDSYHIYGAYFDEFQERFLKNIKSRSFEERTWRTDDPRVRAAINYGKQLLEQERLREQEEENG
ncbi:thymidylate synthase [[Eubacterium] cellulosolvens]